MPKRKYVKKSSNPNESYNIGLKYLRTKYKTENWYTIIDKAKSEADLKIRLLLEQYAYGYKIRFELYNQLCLIKIMKYAST